MKKKVFIFCFLSLFLLTSLFADIEFLPIQNLSVTPGEFSNELHVASYYDYCYLVWNESGDIVFKLGLYEGSNWENTINIYTATDFDGNEPVIACSGSKVYIAYWRNTWDNSEIFFSCSMNNGTNFSSEVQITNSINGAITPMITAQDNTVYIAYEDRDENFNYQIYFIKSTDAGNTWSDPVQLSDPSFHSRQCNLVVYDNILYCVWNVQLGANYDETDLFFTKSTNGGVSWSTPVNISNNQLYNAHSSTFVWDNSVYIVVSSEIDGIQSDIILYRSEDLGETWETPQNLSDNTGNSSHPSIWLTGNIYDDHRIYVVWSDDTFAIDNQVLLKYSVDNGITWSETILVSQGIGESGYAQIVGYNYDYEAVDRLYLVWNNFNDLTLDYDIYGRKCISNYLGFYGTVEGEVYDLVYLNPIENAKVCLNQYCLFTDSTGFFSFDVPQGMCYMQWMALGYLNLWPGIELIVGPWVIICSIPLFPCNPILFSPLNLQAEINDNNVLLTWDEPGSNGGWINWDNGLNDDAIGGVNFQIFDAAIRFDTDDLAQYDGKYLTKFRLFIGDTDCEIYLRVWTNGSQNDAGNLIVDYPLNNLTENAWNTIELSYPIYINASRELWFGYHVINPNCVSPAGIDAGPVVPYKGDMICYYSNWVSMSNYFGWDVNWNIQGYVVGLDGDKGTETKLEPLLPINDDLINCINNQPELYNSNHRPKDLRLQHTHFNVYRNGELISSVPLDTLFYLDTGLENGIYTYYITSVYEEYESDPSDSVTINIISIDDEISTPLITKLEGNYPNPFTQKTKIYYSLRKAGKVSIEIYNLLGQKIKTIINEEKQPGKYYVFWNGTNESNQKLPSGIYFYKMSAGNYSLTKKTILL
ncbi:MAG: T9SS type A sorting domain-containing protein [Candidatus Cloacimonetes bacterium]|nr:T9SS type A sorting domain-containing protein [Candidatus Cloacimonadota bacterium]